MLTPTASKLGCILLAGLLIAAAPAGVNPMSRFDYLTGSFNCTSTSDKPYVESFSRSMTSNWIRGTDTAADGTFTGEHTIGYDKSAKTWNVVSIYPGGALSVGRATIDGPIVAAYPPGMNATLTFTRLSNTSYRVEGHGSYKGASLHFRDTCTKRV